MTCALTSFGKHCRELRSANNQTMGDQAKALGCEVHYISSVETGRIVTDLEYLDKLQAWFRLDAKEFAVLKRRARLSNNSNVTPIFSTSNNSSSMRMFRKVSQLKPSQIRKFRTKIEGEIRDD